MYSKAGLKRPLKKKTKICFQYLLLLNAGQKYCRMLPLEQSAILSTFIKLSYVIKIFVLSIFEWLLKTGFTVMNFEFSEPSVVTTSIPVVTSAGTAAQAQQAAKPGIPDMDTTTCNW